jgi:diadenosine tetraphosphatase ApaH/serine/threonine PP2A family protein phosphatase
MKLFVISDIHSNYEALKDFLDFIEGFRSSDDIIACLGDIIGYGPNPSECISIVRNSCRYVIAGNHERMLLDRSQREFANDRAQQAIEWTESKLSSEEREYLASLPAMLDLDGKYILAHGSPTDPDTYILRQRHAKDAIVALRAMQRFICFIGHTHIPGVFDEDGNYYYQENAWAKLQPDKLYLINPGSIGQPRDRDRRASFCMLDEDLNITFYRYEYDIEKVFEGIKREGLPEELGERLFYGV